MRPHKLNKKTLPGFVEKNVCKVQKKHISLHPANTRRRPLLGQRWANVVDGGLALAQHRDNTIDGGWLLHYVRWGKTQHI